MPRFRVWCTVFVCSALGCGEAEIEMPPPAAVVDEMAGWRDRGIDFEENGDFHSAVAVYDEALAHSTETADILLARGSAWERAGNATAALDDFQAVLQIKPNEADAWRGIGNCRFRLGNNLGAIDAVTRAIELGPPDAFLFHARGAARYYAGQLQDALTDYDEAVRLEPDDSISRAARGALLVELGEHARAIADLDFRLAKEPEESDTWARRARAYVELGYLSRGIADFEEAIKHSPGDPAYYAYLGSLYLSIHDFDAAAVWFGKAVRIDAKRRGLVLSDVSPTKLTEDDLEHGRAQVEHLFRDRPVLAEHIDEGDALWTWAVRQFAGESTRARIRWDPHPPVGSDGECVLPSTNTLGAIRIGKRESSGPFAGAPLTFQRVWSPVVFECFNHVAQAEFEAHHRRILAGEIAPVAFARNYLETEELTVCRTRQFFCDVFLPWAKSTQFDEVDPRAWFVGEWMPVDGIDREARLRGDGRWDHYLSDGYAIFAYGLAERKNTEAAIRYLETALVEDVLTPNVKARLYYAKAGYVNNLQGETAATEAFDEAIRLDPTFLNAYVERGMIARDANEALADFEMAIRLAPDDPRGYGLRGNLRYERGDLDAALEDYDCVIEMNPNDASSYFARAAIWLAKNDARRELADLDKCIDLQPDHVEARLRRAEIYVLNDDPAIRNGDAAIQDATRTGELTKWEDASSILMLAAAHAEAGRRDEAVKWQRKAAELVPPENRANIEAVIPIYESGKTLRDAQVVSDRKD